MSPQPFGTLPTGESVELYTLANDRGFSVEIMPYGATVVSIQAPDRDGRIDHVALGFGQLASYVASHPYMGVIAGRVAGRITGAKFTLDGKTHELVVNDPPNHLHGGQEGFDKKLWSASPVSRPDGANAVRFSHRSVDGEEGYPGTVDVSVTYAVTSDGALVVETEATTDQATPFALAQHTYFNLAGEKSGNIADHEIEIFADSYAPTDETMTLLGRRESVAGKANDFRTARRIGDALPGLFKSHGDYYFLSRQTPGELRVAARVRDPKTGRVLAVSTTEDGVQLYSGASLDEANATGRGGQVYGRFAGFCLECQGYADGANVPALGDIILRPGQPLRQTTIYAFSTF